MRRNLYYNCCPIAYSREEWMENVRRLCSYGDLWTGRKIVVIKTGDIMDPPELVEACFTLPDIEFRLVRNDPVLHETAGFLDTLGDLCSLREDEITFYAHTKGVRVAEPTEVRRVSVMQWRNRMYEECLRDPDKIDELLSTYATAGCFKLPELDPRRAPWSSWHYSGTFYWFNHARLFSHNWRYLGGIVDRYTPENYLGVHIADADACNLYGDPHQRDLYNIATGVFRCPACERTFRTQLHRPRRCCRRSKLGFLQKPELLYHPEFAEVIVGSRRSFLRRPSVQHLP